MEPLIEEGSDTKTAASSTKISNGTRNCFKVHSKTDWFLEIGNALLSLMCLLGMIILLARIQDQPLSSWSLEVSPNAVLSILSTASKACLIQPVSECISQLKWLHLLQSPKPDRLTDLQKYDDASRGPMGSSKFFYKRPTNSFLPYLGCLMTLAAIALDPFTQQILRFDSRLAEVDGVHSRLKTSQIYDFGSSGAPDMGGSTFQSPRDIPMRSAVNLALYSEPQLPDLVCPGSVCEYPPFASIGITTNCQDVTIPTRENCTQDKRTGAQRCIFTTPAGLQLYGKTAFSAHWGFTHTRVNTSLDNTVGDWSPMNDALLRFGVIRFAPNFASYSTWKDGMKVHECTYALSAFEYSDWSITNGTINPGLTKAYPLNLTEPGYPSGYTVLDQTFPHNRTFSVNFMDMNNMRQILEDALAPAPPDSVRLNVLLYDSADIPATMANISKSMSHRMLSGPNATVTNVPVLKEQIVITVRWAWISLPTALVAAMCLFLLVIIYQTHRAEHLIWKSSLTPLLLSQESYPMSRAGQKPLWTRSYLKMRTAVITNHLTD
ncbi:hypothetical protein PG985_009284 [Apiospora marii]|uniref:Uncharacterized protein n=1 Tax=Apiospora marii TaxID=335849 RepID=A0ABR1RA47_9PEZI